MLKNGGKKLSLSVCESIPSCTLTVGSPLIPSVLSPVSSIGVVGISAGLAGIFAWHYLSGAISYFCLNTLMYKKKHFNRKKDMFMAAKRNSGIDESRNT